MIRDLKGTTESERAQTPLVTLDKPTKEMQLEATTAGFYTSPIDEEHQKPMLPLQASLR
jgi:hypothetical protein